MSSEPAVLLPLAESIADGTSVDWATAEARASGDEQAIIRQLRILADLAVLHRSLPAQPVDSPPPSLARGTNAAPAIGNWAHLALVERLGGGTFGEVYRAWDRHLEREVALKLLRVDEAPGDPQVSRIAIEGRLLARMRHPNVVTVHGVAVHDQRVGLWMELIRGATLEQLLLKHGPFSAREAALIGIDLCCALAAVHAAGLIHRDVKAQNVMREDGGRIVLMDLGTGREIDASRRHVLPDLAGTPLYLAPEIFNGAPASVRSDLYSLGVLLYHLVTGSYPVRATTIEELQDGHAKGTGVRLRDARADLPTAFVRVVDRAIASDPDRRYDSAGALEADLVQALDDTAAPPAPGTADAGTHASPIAWRTKALAAGLIAMLALAALLWPALRGRQARGAAPGSIRSIAVLPLANLSGDPAQEYFADGMTEVLIDDLAKIRALRVISRTSVMQFKGMSKPLPEIARTLNVDAVLEGSVLRSGDRVRISADLVHVASDRHIWVESYERDVRDVLALQSEVARTIARAVQIQLTPQEQAGFATARSVDPAAQEAYLQGRYYWNKRRLSDLRTGLEYFQRAVQIDPTFALAYAGQADCYNLLVGQLPPIKAYPLAKAAALKALEIDPTLAEAHTSLAFARFVFDRDLAGAETAFKRGIELNPNYATAHHWYAEYLSAMNRPVEAVREIEIARTLDPLSSSIRTSHGSIFYMAHDYDKAAAHFRSSLQLKPNDPEARYFLGLTYAQKRMPAEASAEMQEALKQSGRNSEVMAGLATVAAVAGRVAEARRIIDELNTLFPDRYVPPEQLAFIYAGLGDSGSAVKWLRKAQEEHSPGVMWAAVEPMLDPLRRNPGFIEVMRRLGLLP